MVAIVDYGMGNLRSLRNAIRFLGYDAIVVSQPEEFAGADRVILPGVGAFGKAMDNLRARRLDAAIRDWVQSDRPLLGICLGMQLLATTGYEFGTHDGLGVIDGEVVPFIPTSDCPIPHVGWNDYALTRRHPVFANVKKTVDFYFVHSFHFVPAAEDCVLSRTQYGLDFVSALAHGPVVGVQFHPEKSQQSGLTLLENFLAWDGTC